MIKQILLFLMLITNTCMASALTEGIYKGHGLWHSEMKKGDYSVTTAINANIVSAHYEHQDGKKREWKFEMDPTVNGFFNVKTFGAVIGSGYCLDQAELCHYEISVGNLKLEETLTTQNNKLYKFGSKNEGSGRIFWQESLSKE